MTTIKIVAHPQTRALTDDEKAELSRKLFSASSIIKLACGVGNNAAWMVMSHAMGELKKSPRYQHEIKRAFKVASTEIHRYENQLITANVNRMFHVADMSPEIRKRYDPNMRDRDYYEFWKNIGVTAYIKTTPLINSLQHKFALSLVSHGVKDPELIAWCLTAQATLNIAVELYRSAIKHSHEDLDISQRLVESIFGQFSIEKVSDRWRDACHLLAPDANDYTLDDVEARNIAVGFEQLRDEWFSPDMLYSVTGETAADYGEIFATKGYQKKVLREIADVRAETKKELEKEL